MNKDITCGQTVPTLITGLYGGVDRLAHKTAMLEAIEGEKKNEPHIGIGHLHEADMEMAYNDALRTIEAIINKIYTS